MHVSLLHKMNQVLHVPSLHITILNICCRGYIVVPMVGAVRSCNGSSAMKSQVAILYSRSMVSIICDDSETNRSDPPDPTDLLAIQTT